MRIRTILALAALSVGVTPLAVFAQDEPPASHEPQASQDAPYTTDTTPLGALMADPKAKAILAKEIPDIVNNEQIAMANGMTLKALQAYAGDLLSDEILAKIDAELALIKHS
ncbi:hypothetical protein MTR62_09350 [Novosphingobium sp. 1949]|uniref:Uncharacterized protein n=1 Tax=Novosphingobium organovorum TaxID=2930092 RepID=A0ABT0BDM4_9SPHN|nr:hypothetical protein [Novosphingobium organovorum]MCJ2182894.1 hypothetical protein [Novosphingobium organovorum]